MCKIYSVQRRTRRWPLAMFYGLLNIVGVNSMVLHQLAAKKKETRRNFLKTLAFQLMKPHMERRLEKPTLQRNLKDKITEILEYEETKNMPKKRKAPQRTPQKTPQKKTPQTPQKTPEQTPKKPKIAPKSPVTPRKTQGRCYLCPASKDSKFATVCDNCEGFVCLKHRGIFCTSCLEKECNNLAKKIHEKNKNL